MLHIHAMLMLTTCNTRTYTLYSRKSHHATYTLYIHDNHTQNTRTYTLQLVNQSCTYPLFSCKSHDATLARTRYTLKKTAMLVKIHQIVAKAHIHPEYIGVLHSMLTNLRIHSCTLVQQVLHH